MTQSQTYWAGNTLMHCWYGSKEADEIGYLRPNTDKRKAQAWVFEANTNDDLFVKYYYVKPNAYEVFSDFLNWQNG